MVKFVFFLYIHNAFHSLFLKTKRKYYSLINPVSDNSEPKQWAFEINRMFSLFWPQMHSWHADLGSTSVAMGSVSQSGGFVTAPTTAEMVPMSCLPSAVSTRSFQSNVDGAKTTPDPTICFFSMQFFYLQWQRLVDRPSSAAATDSTDVCQCRGTATARLTVRMELTREAVVN